MTSSASCVTLLIPILLSASAFTYPLPFEYLPLPEPMLHPTTRGVTKSLPCTAPVIFEGALWWGMGTLAIIIILSTGLLAGLTLGVMSIDSTRLRVWSNTGAPERRY